MFFGFSQGNYKKVYNYIMNSINVKYKKNTIFINSENNKIKTKT